jgi:hypothetical protein
MGQTLEQFSAAVHGVLAADPGPNGRTRVRALVEDVLKDPDFVARHVGANGAERTILYEDKDLGFVIVAHVHHAARVGKPHDHGSSWAIYGQASGETEMSDWTAVERAAEGKSGKARHLRTYILQPGMAHLYNEGDLHSLKQDGPTRLIRVEGTNLDKVKRYGYQAV